MLLTTDWHADKNTLTHTHSKKHTGTAYKKLFSGSLRHIRYIGQLSSTSFTASKTHWIWLWSNSVFRLLVEDSQHKKKLCQSVGVGLLVRHTRVKNKKSLIYETVVVIICVKMRGGERIGVGRPCPRVRNVIVSPRHLLQSCDFCFSQMLHSRNGWLVKFK